MRIFIILITIFIFYSSISYSDVLYTSKSTISEILALANVDNENIDGDVLISMTGGTGIVACPIWLYVKNTSESKNLLSIAISSYIAGKPLKFQVWNDSDRFWAGSSSDYCQIRAIRVQD